MDEQLFRAFVGEGDDDLAEGVMSRAMPLPQLTEWISAVVKGISHPERVYIRIYTV